MYNMYTRNLFLLNLLGFKCPKQGLFSNENMAFFKGKNLCPHEGKRNFKSFTLEIGEIIRCVTQQFRNPVSKSTRKE